MQNEMQPATAPIEQMVERLGVRSVFGEPLHEQGTTVIPVAQVTLGFGYGSGYGRSNDEPADERDGAVGELSAQDEGGGTGGGAGGRAIPCGYIRISDDGVSYEPIEDKTRIPLAGIVLAGWAVLWIGLTIRTIAKAVAKTRQMKIKRATG